MKTTMMMGTVSCGKTTLCQRLAGLRLEYQKTQSVCLVDQSVDTPGEYLENRGLYKALIVTAVDVDVVVFLQDATDERFRYSPGQAAGFGNPVIGVVTKADLATPEQVQASIGLLELAGASRVFAVSAVTGQGLGELVAYLEE